MDPPSINDMGGQSRMERMEMIHVYHSVAITTVQHQGVVATELYAANRMESM